jgi:hypothetical protein
MAAVERGIVANDRLSGRVAAPTVTYPFLLASPLLVLRPAGGLAVSQRCLAAINPAEHGFGRATTTGVQEANR